MQDYVAQMCHWLVHESGGEMSPQTTDWPIQESISGIFSTRKNKIYP